MRLLLALAFIVSLASLAVADNVPIDIPLTRIWSSGMPGTKPITDLDPEVVKSPEYAGAKDYSAVGQVLVHRLKDKSLVYQFINQLESVPEDKQPLQGFAVSDTGMGALRNATLGLRMQSSKLPKGETTLVFFAHPTGANIQLQKVSRSNKEVAIRYRAVPQESFARGCILCIDSALEAHRREIRG